MPHLITLIDGYLSTTVARSLVFVALYGASPLVSAFDLADQSVTLELGIEASTNVFRAEDDEVELISSIEYEIGRFLFYPFGVSATLWEWRGTSTVDQPDVESPWEFEVFTDIEFGLGKREQADNPVFSGMQDRDEDTLFTIGADWVTPMGLFIMSFGGDVGSASGGFEAELGWGVPLFDIDPIDTWLGFGVLVQNEDLVEHLYGVRDDEASEGRPAYGPGAAVSAYLNIGAGITLGRGWEIGAELLIEQIPDEILRSPLTDNNKIGRSFGLLLLRRFGGVE